MALSSKVMGQTEAAKFPITSDEKARRVVHKYASLDAEDGNPLDFFASEEKARREVHKYASLMQKMATL